MVGQLETVPGPVPQGVVVQVAGVARQELLEDLSRRAAELAGALPSLDLGAKDLATLAGEVQRINARPADAEERVALVGPAERRGVNSSGFLEFGQTAAMPRFFSCFATRRASSLSVVSQENDWFGEAEVCKMELFNLLVGGGVQGWVVAALLVWFFCAALFKPERIRGPVSFRIASWLLALAIMAPSMVQLFVIGSANPFALAPFKQQLNQDNSTAMASNPAAPLLQHILPFAFVT